MHHVVLWFLYRGLGRLRYLVLTCFWNAAVITLWGCRYDGVRFGARAATDSLKEMYCLSRGQSLGEEVKRRILMGTYALSAGYYDAFYKKAQQVCGLP
jgi:aspartyl-tRNA(Asn)/glutamyl-tRNA(Gln) amidotransferase subunit A